MNRNKREIYHCKETTYKSYSVFASVYYELNMMHFSDTGVLQVRKSMLLIKPFICFNSQLVSLSGFLREGEPIGYI